MCTQLKNDNFIHDDDIIYLQSKSKIGTRYICRSMDIITRRAFHDQASLNPNLLSTVNLYPFLRENMPLLWKYQSVQVKEGSLEKVVDGIRISGYQKPSIDTDEKQKIAFQIQRESGPGILKIGESFKLLSLDQSLTNDRRILAPINRHGPPSFNDPWNEVGYISLSFTENELLKNNQGAIWVSPPFNDYLEYVPMEYGKEYNILQRTKQSFLHINKQGNLTSETLYLSPDEPTKWTIEQALHLDLGLI